MIRFIMSDIPFFVYKEYIIYEILYFIAGI